jgi:hypothetical protein
MSVPPVPPRYNAVRSWPILARGTPFLCLPTRKHTEIIKACTHSLARGVQSPTRSPCCPGWHGRRVPFMLLCTKKARLHAPAPSHTHGGCRSARDFHFCCQDACCERTCTDWVAVLKRNIEGCVRKVVTCGPGPSWTVSNIACSSHCIRTHPHEPMCCACHMFRDQCCSIGVCSISRSHTIICGRQ